MRKTLKHPITVSLSKEVSKFTNRITFRLRYYDAVNHKRLPELSKKLDFYAYGKSDSEAFYKAKVHREKAQVEINSKGYHPKKLNTTDFIAFFTELTLQKNEGTREVYQHAVQHLKLFLKADVLPFDKVEELLIESFKRYLLDELAQNTANTYFSAILHGIKKARKYIKDFIEVKRIRQVKSYKSDLSEEQIQVLWNTEMPNHDGTVRTTLPALS